MRLTPSIRLVGSTAYGLTAGNDCSVYLVRGPEGEFLIDAGNGYDTKGLIANIRREDGEPGDISHVLVTHHHTDHARGAKALHDGLGCKVWISENTGKYLLEQGTDEELGVSFAKKHGMYPQDYTYIHCPVDRAVKDGEQFVVAGVEITAINVIGHSRDSLCYLMELDGLRCLFSGDIVFFGGTLGLLNFPMSSLEDYHVGMERLKDVKFDAFFPGHGVFTLQNGKEIISMAHKNLDSIFVPQSVQQTVVATV